jgi:hypothetical protein
MTVLKFSITSHVRINSNPIENTAETLKAMIAKDSYTLDTGQKASLSSV